MSTRIEITVCMLLAIAFGAISYSAVITKFPTYDEPIHFGAAYASWFHHDYRINPENPPLWEAWPMLPIRRGAIRVDPSNAAWRHAGELEPGRRWETSALFSSDAAATIAWINRARFMMMLLGAMTCLATAWWGHKLSGPWGAIAATTLLAMDPTFLGHGSLVKNDVPLALAMLMAMIAMWRAGQRLTWWNLLALSVACGVAINTKFSAVLIPAFVVICLMLRALLPMPWEVLGRHVRSRIAKGSVVLVIAAIVVFTTIAITWVGYGFQFAPSLDPSLALQTDLPRPVGIDHLLVFAESHHLLPSSFCVGLIRQHTAIQNTPNFLLGSQNGTGWWYYYPFAFAVKTPLATLFLLCVAVSFAIRLRKSRSIFPESWAALCILVPAGGFLICAMCSSYNHGLRSLLPIYPMIYIAAGAVFARMVAHRPRPAKIAGALLLAGLMIETLSAYPNYIAFFNTAAGGSRGGLGLLGDSNLDWGQDLSLLARWRQDNPNVRLYLNYFGEVDPGDLGIDFIPLPGYWIGAETAPNPNQPGVLAISATLLQGVYVRPPWDGMYAVIRTWKPRQVLGGTIYLYDYPPPEMSSIR